VRSSIHFTNDVTRVHGDLVAEAAADVRGDDLDVLLRQSRDEREHGAMRVRRLRGHVDRRLPGRRIDVRDAAAALERRGMAARIVRDEPDHLVGFGERLLGRFCVAGLPVVDPVVLLVFLVVADHRRVRFEPGLRAGDDGERVVVDVDQLERVVRDVHVLGDDARDLLPLHAHLVGREHGLRVAGERRHPCEVVLREDVPRHDHDDPGQLARTRRVDRVDLGVRERAAQDRHVEHVRELDVLDVGAAADDEARVLLALDALAQPTTAALGLDGGHDDSFSLFAAH
jgi:hypothetical protein